MRVAIKSAEGVRVVSVSDVSFDNATGQLMIKPVVGDQISWYLGSDEAVRIPSKLTQLLETGYTDLCSN